MNKAQGTSSNPAAGLFSGGIAFKGMGWTARLVEAGLEGKNAVGTKPGIARMCIVDMSGSQANRMESKVASMVNGCSGPDYVVVNGRAGMSATEKVELLQRFHRPERVEIVATPGKVQDTVREVILKMIGGVPETRARAGSKGGSGFEGLTVVWPTNPTGILRHAVLEGAAETLADLQSGKFTGRMGGVLSAKRMERCDLVLDLADDAWRSLLSEAIARPEDAPRKTAGPRPGPLDGVEATLAATRDLRVDSGKLSAVRVAEVFGVAIAELARWVGRSKQAVAKTPDADSLQSFLEHLERVARLRAVTRDDAEFRKWLRAANVGLAKRRPMDLLVAGHWQALADKVDDMLTGAPG